MSMFDAKVIVSEQMERLIACAASELACRAIVACGNEYKFNGDEAIRLLGLNAVKVSRTSVSSRVSKASKASKVVVAKSSFPLPYSGECNDAMCHGLRQNNGLYTQCQAIKKEDKLYCKSCQSSSDKNDGVPEYGTIEQRQAVGIFEYVDPKGRKPTAYAKIMKKFKVTKEEVLEEAGKLSITIDDNHFNEHAQEGKRGRPKAEKPPKEPKGAKGRPKKTKKVLEIEGEEDDLFASLVASANAEEEEEQQEDAAAIVVKPVKKGKSDEERILKEQEKAAKEAQRIKEKAEKEAKVAAEKAEKEAKKEADRIAKELKKIEEESAKKNKEAEKATKTKKPVEEEDEEPDVVKKIVVDEKKYLKSKKTGIIYDYTEYSKNGEQVVVGKWNELKNKIDFVTTEEESEEEYDEEEE